MIACASIRGIGMVTALGRSAHATWHALIDGASIVDHAVVPVDTPRGRSRIEHLAQLAVAEAIADAAWSPSELQDEQTAIVVGTSKGAVLDWLSAPSDDRNDGGQFNPPMLGSLATSLARTWKISGPVITISAACASGLQALIRAQFLIRSGQARRALVVGAEASVHPLFLNSFQRLGVLSTTKVCRPLDAHRDGFLMSEAATAVCLDGSETGVRISACALGGDAHHLTGSDPNGVMLSALLGRLRDGPAVDLIHSHATGTKTHDPVELNAMGQTFADSDQPPTVYSHKGALGHSLGASGLLSVAINVMCHRHGMIPGNIHTLAPLTAPGLSISARPTARPVRHSIALAAGFGGAAAAVRLFGTD